VVEVVVGTAALAAVAYGTPADLRVTSSFWVEPYTVISALILAAAARRIVLGALGAAWLTGTYLVCVIVWVPGGSLSRAATATAWTNALSYLPFFAIGAIGFRPVRSIVGQTETLRRQLARISAERARVAAASGAYRIGHDIPKALLREVRRGQMTTDRLRPWAIRYRDDLLAAIGETPKADLPTELALLASAFGAAVTLAVELGSLGPDLPPGTPALLVVEATRELLNNASYHAYGYPATLRARSSPELVEVTVHNDGPGVDPVRLRSTWARKQNTVHQLEAAGGTYQITSALGSLEGTTVTLSYRRAAPTEGGKTAPGGS